MSEQKKSRPVVGTAGGGIDANAEALCDSIIAHSIRERKRVPEASSANEVLR